MTIKDIETAVVNLPPNEFAEFAEWFEEYQAKRWDEQIEDDLNNGRLEHLISEVETGLKEV